MKSLRFRCKSWGFVEIDAECRFDFANFLFKFGNLFWRFWLKKDEIIAWTRALDDSIENGDILWWKKWMHYKNLIFMKFWLVNGNILRGYIENLENCLKKWQSLFWKKMLFLNKSIELWCLKWIDAYRLVYFMKDVAMTLWIVWKRQEVYASWCVDELKKLVMCIKMCDTLSRYSVVVDTARLRVYAKRSWTMRVQAHEAVR